MFDVIDSISCRMWLETMTLFPERPHSLISRMVLRRASGSMPDSGSSRIEQLRIVRERLRQLHALPHALAVGADLLAGRVGQIDQLERAPRQRGRLLVADAVEPDERGHPFEPGHPLVERILLGTEADAEIQRRIAPDRLAEHRQRALARPAAAR